MDHMERPTPAPVAMLDKRSDLTPEEYATIKPLLDLADLGNTPARSIARAEMPAGTRRHELKQRFLTALKEHGTLTHAAAAAGIGRNTAWRWCRDDPDFNAEVTAWMHEDQVNELHESLYKIATSQDPKVANAAVKAGTFLLQSLDRDTYGDHLKTETTVNVNQQVDVTLTIRDKFRAEREHQVQQLRQARTIDALPPSESENP